MKSYNVALVGSFDVENYGDLLFPIVLENELKNRINLNKIYMFSPNGGIKPFSKEKIYPVKDLEKIIQEKRIDVIMIGGGNVIRIDKFVTVEYNLSYEASCSFWQIPILLASKYNIKVVFNAPGLPVKFNGSQQRFNKFFLDKVDYISVRDEVSKENLGNNYNNKCIVVPDTINMIPNIYSKEELSKNFNKLIKNKIIPNVSNYILLQTRKIENDEEHYISKIKELIDYITSVEKKNVVIMPIGYVHKDIDICSKLTDKNNKLLYIIDNKLNPYDMLTVIANSKGFIGSSLHGLLTSNIYNVNIMAINKECLGKVRGFMKLINKENLEVNNIDECLDKYKNEFYKQNFKKNKYLQKCVSSHFDTIANIITSNQKKEDNDDYYSFFNELYEFVDNYEVMLKENGQLKNEVNVLENEIHNLLNSKSFKITAPLRKIMAFKSKDKIK